MSVSSGPVVPTILLGALLLAAGPEAQALETEVLRDTGPSSNRINLVILGDGYTAGEMTLLHDDAVAVLDGLFTIEPYADYQSYFRATLVYVVSNESGADHPEGSTPSFRDTALGATYECSPGMTDLLCVNTGTAQSIAAAHVSDFDLVVVVVNDDAEGGSGGSVVVTSRNVTGHPLLPARVAHEMGHTLGGLADESQSPIAGYPPCSFATDCAEPNVTLRTEWESIKWNHWMDEPVPLPTPAVSQYDGVIGLFEGARYLDSDIYRPAISCRMRSVDAEFCAVCQEALVKAIYDRVSPIDSQAPAQSLELLIGEERTLSVASLQNESAALSVSWRIDDVVQVGETGAELLVRAAELGGGTHTVTTEVRDLTSRVRNDPDGDLHATASWTIGVTGCGDGTLQAGEQCDALNDGSYGGCNPDCTLAARCGDDVVEATHEACDDGPDNDGRYGGCNPDCTRAARCGDDVVDDTREACDDGPENDGRYGGCSSDCTLAGRCGDGIVEGAEACDEGAGNDGSYGGCKADCTLAGRCGDGVVEGAEACDGDAACSDSCELIEAPTSPCGCGAASSAPLSVLLALAHLLVVRRRSAHRARP